MTENTTLCDIFPGITQSNPCIFICIMLPVDLSHQVPMKLTSFICCTYVCVWLVQTSYAHIQDWSGMNRCPFSSVSQTNYVLFHQDWCSIVDVCLLIVQITLQLLSLDWHFKLVIQSTTQKYPFELTSGPSSRSCTSGFWLISKFGLHSISDHQVLTKISRCAIKQMMRLRVVEIK